MPTKEYCGNKPWNFRPKITNNNGKYTDDIKGISNKIASQPDYNCDDNNTQTISTPSVCYICKGITGDSIGVETRRKEFIKSYIKTTKRVGKGTASDKKILSLCPTISAMANGESNFSEYARSWDSFCGYGTVCKSESDTNKCNNNDGESCELAHPSDTSFIPGGICQKGNCLPIQGGFGQLQFDLVWDQGTALQKFEKMPVTSHQQLEALFGINSKVINGSTYNDNNNTIQTMIDNMPCSDDPDVCYTFETPSGNNPKVGPLSRYFQTCFNSSPQGEHFSKEQYDQAKNTCWNLISKDPLFSGAGYFSNKDDYFNAADIAGSSACPVNNLYPNNIKNLGTPPFS